MAAARKPATLTPEQIAQALAGMTPEQRQAIAAQAGIKVARPTMSTDERKAAAVEAAQARETQAWTRWGATLATLDQALDTLRSAVAEGTSPNRWTVLSTLDLMHQATNEVVNASNARLSAEAKRDDLTFEPTPKGEGQTEAEQVARETFASNYEKALIAEGMDANDAATLAAKTATKRAVRPKSK